MDLAEVIRRRRRQLGLSQSELARAAGIGVRQIVRYEAGEQQPVLPVAVALADALGISLERLAGRVSEGPDLVGEWTLAWAPIAGVCAGVTLQRIRVVQERAEQFHLAPIDYGSDAAERTVWRGALRLWDQSSCMGWFAAADGGACLRGALYFTLAADVPVWHGRWVGASPGGTFLSGAVSMARSDEIASSSLVEP